MNRPEPTSKQREVRHLLHTLRGEHARHERNMLGIRAQPPPYQTHHNPTLPLDQIFAEKRAQSPAFIQEPRIPIRLGPQGVLEYDYPRGPVPGPRIPPSWGALFAAAEPVDEVEQRSEAFSLIFSHLPPSADDAQLEGSVPRLTLLCLQYLLSLCSDDSNAFAEMAAFLPSHLRRDLLHRSAVYMPLSTARLNTLYDPDGHVDGEVIFVGPYASFPGEFFQKQQDCDHKRTPDADDSSESEEWTWDSLADNIPPPTHTVILFNVSIPLHALLSFPPTLTHLALINLPAPIHIYRLPASCPLLEVLDVSFNAWLSNVSEDDPEGYDALHSLDKVRWDRWSRLRILGLRGCDVRVRQGFMKRLNQGREVDVDLVM